MTTLKMDDQTARRLYPTANKEFKEMLESSFGKEFFNQKIRDQITGWQDILSLSGVDPKTMQLRPGEEDDELAHREWKLIAKVYNQGVVLDAGNTDQPKYFVWGKIVKDKSKPSGFGLAYYGHGRWNSLSNVGVRLCFKDPDDSIDAFKKFIDIRERMAIR